MEGLRTNGNTQPIFGHLQRMTRRGRASRLPLPGTLSVCLAKPRCKGSNMLRATLLGAVCVLVVCGVIGHERGVMGQDKDSDSIGDKIDRGVKKVEAKLRETWVDIQRATRRMTVEARVYARLYWDKSLADALLKIEVKDEGVIVLKGSVPTLDAKHRAFELAQSTVGVNQAIDELAVAPSKAN